MTSSHTKKKWKLSSLESFTQRHRFITLSRFSQISFERVTKSSVKCEISEEVDSSLKIENVFDFDSFVHAIHIAVEKEEKQNYRHLTRNAIIIFHYSIFLAGFLLVSPTTHHRIIIVLQAVKCCFWVNCVNQVWRSERWESKRRKNIAKKKSTTKKRSKVEVRNVWSWHTGYGSDSKWNGF